MVIDFGPSKLEDRKGEAYLLVGSPGSGKTTTFKRLFESAFPRILIIDSEDMEFPEFEKVGKLKDMNELARAMGSEWKPFKWRWVPPPPPTKAQLMRAKSKAARLALPDPDREIDQLCRAMLYHTRHVLLYFDEISDFCSSSYMPRNLKFLYRRARKRGICVAAGTQRPQAVHKDAWNNSIHKQVFYIDTFDRQYMDRLAPGLGEQVAQIEYGTYRSLYIGKGRTELMEAV